MMSATPLTANTHFLRQAWFCVLLRALIGGFFVAVGTDKILHPYENFLYVVQEYRILPDILEEMTARFFPWVELFLGLFLALGLWLKWTLRVLLFVIGIFILIILQALVRQLPIGNCGCFGSLFTSDIHHTMILDLTLWVFLRLLQHRPNLASRLSLDSYFEKTDK